MNEVLSNVRGMVREAKNTHNDGYVAKGYKDELKKIHSYIELELPDFRYTPTDGLEVGSAEDYELQPNKYDDDRHLFHKLDNGENLTNEEMEEMRDNE